MGNAMSHKSSLGRYLQLIKDQWNQTRDALHGYERVGKKINVTRPPDIESDMLQQIFAQAIAEASQAGDSLFGLALPRLKNLQLLHKAYLEQAWYLHERGILITSHQFEYYEARKAAEAAWMEINELLPAIEAAQPDDKSSVSPILTDRQRAVLEILQALPKDKGLQGHEIIRKLRERKRPIEMSRAVLTKHIIPVLKKHHGVTNTPGVGYHVRK
jgi:hypothetical protein